MDRKLRMCSVITTLLVFATLSILPIDGTAICPWCDKNKQPRLLDCMYTGMISSPELMMIPLPDIDDVKWQVASYSDSLTYMSYDAKKLAVDKKFCSEIANVITKNNYQNNHAVINVLSGLAGNCYSSVTGYDPSIVTEDVKAMVKENINKKNSAPPLVENPNPEPNSRMSYPANQNQQNNFQSPLPPIQPPLNAPFNPPGSSPVNSFNTPPSGNSAPFNPPGQSPVHSFGNPPSANNGPYNPPESPPVNSFNNPTNKAPFNPPGQSTMNPPSGNDGPFNPPLSPPMNPSNNPSLGNNAAGPSENWSSNDNEEQGQERSDFSKNQKPSGGPSGSPLQNDKESQDDNNSPITASPKMSSPSQDSKLTNSDSSENSYWTTLSPNTEASQKKTAGNEKSDNEEEPCDEKFKTALYNELIHDDRFCNFFTKLPTSSTKPEVPKIIKHAFKEYGIEEQRYKEFLTFWKLESQTLNKESKADDWDEVISKISKIIFSRTNLLKGDCEEDGRKFASYILDTFPGDPAASSTENTNQNEGNDETSTESNSNSSGQKANPASNSPENTSTESNSNSEKATDSKNLSFPELHSKLSSIFKNNGSTEQNDGNVPFSELLTKFEMQDMLGKLHSAALDCMSPSGFDFDKFLPTMTNVAASIQKNHPDWSQDKCQKEMYSATIAVLTEALQKTLKNNNNNAKSQSSSTQPSSAVDTGDSQSSNSDMQPQVPNDYDLPSDDSTYPGPGTDYDSDSAPQQQQDYSDYGGYADGTGSENIPSPGNQPGPDYWQPSNQNFPPQDYPAGPPTNMNAHPYSGNQPNFAPDYGAMNPPNKNFGNSQFQADYPSDDYGFDAGPPEAQPVAPNGNSQNFPPRFNQDYDYGAPAARPNYNTQPQFNPNYNSGVPPAGPNYNSQPQFNPNYNSGVPPAGPNYNTQPQFNSNSGVPPAGPNYNTQPQFNSNSRVPPTGPNYNTQPQFNPNYNSRVPANGPAVPQW